MALRVIEAERFVLVDTQGRPRMTMEVLPDDSAALVLLNEHGKSIARVMEVRGKPTIQLLFEDKLRASLVVAPDASTALVVGADPANVTVGTMAEEPCVVLRRHDGATRVISVAGE